MSEHPTNPPKPNPREPQPATPREASSEPAREATPQTGSRGPDARILKFPERSSEPDPTDDRPGPGGVPVGPVVEGELLSDAENAALDARLAAARAGELVERPDRTPRVARARAAAATAATATAKAAGKAGRAGVRHSYLVAAGHASWAKRGMDALTHAHLREQIRQARLAGDREALAEWLERLNTLKDARAARVRELPATLAAGLRALLVGVVVTAGLLLVAGVAFQLTPGGFDWNDWWELLADIAEVIGLALTAAVYAVLWGGVPAALLLAWREGKRRGLTPPWLLTADERAEADSEITADLLTRALANMKISKLTSYLTKEGGALEYLVTPREQGGGTYTQIRLPMGCTAAELLPSAKVELLAGNLGRHRHEVWPQRQPNADARVLDLWVADKGTLDKPAPPWPLLHDGEFDVYRDRLPWGVTMRSEPVEVGMRQKHWLVGATSKQGKTTAVRLLALGLALDPTVELRIADLKGDGDWSMFAPRATVLIEGNTPAHAEQTCELLEWAVEEMTRRYEAKRAKGIVGGITRELARRKGSGFHPIYLIVDECQVLYGEPHPIGGTKDGARAVRAAKTLHDQARAVEIHLIQATQRPDDRTLPVRVREGAHARCALNVPNYETAKMILADAADRGARPQDLRAGADAGTVVATGEIEDIPKGQAFAIVRTHYVSTKDAYPVIARAMKIMERHGRMVADPAPVEDDSEPERVLLDDVATVMGGVEKVRSSDVLTRLKQHWPDTYGDWSAQQLAATLSDEGVEIRKVSIGGQPGQRAVCEDDITAAQDRMRQADQGPDEQ